MAYFSNGSEGSDYQERYCMRCFHFTNEGDGRGPGCPVWDAHLMYAYGAEGDMSIVLDMLIPRDEKGLYADECNLFVLSPTADGGQS